MLQAGSKRRRTKKQIAAEKLAKEQYDADIAEKLARLAVAEAKLVAASDLKGGRAQTRALWAAVRSGQLGDKPLEKRAVGSEGELARTPVDIGLR